ncbi:MAG: M48 family metalloprotease [Planctomycetes bacterium]|nr:M48 family metalloprotease [Planctomycetota bacterium]
MKYTFIILLLTVLATSACRRDAITGEMEFNLYSWEADKQLGDDAAPAIIAQLGGLYPDAALQDYVNEIGQKVVRAARADLHKESNFPDWQFHFYIVNDSMLNAFALPGGHIFITRGMLLKLDNEAELAGLLGHEVMHVFGSHGSERMSSSAAMQIGVAVAGSFDESGTLAAIGGTGLGLLGLKYSRDNESESDEYGMRFAARAGYNPEGIVGVMEMLDEASAGPSQPEFMSTHPNPANRVSTLTSQLKREFQGKGEGITGVTSYQSGIQEVLNSVPAYEFADSGDQIMYAALNLASEGGDKAEVKQQLKQARELYEKAIAQRSGHSILHVKLAQSEFYLDRPGAAEIVIAKAISIEPQGFWPNYMGGLIAAHADQHTKCISRMTEALAVVPESPIGVYYMAHSNDQLDRKQEAVDYYTQAWALFGGQGQYAEASRERLIALGATDPAVK